MGQPENCDNCGAWCRGRFWKRSCRPFGVYHDRPEYPLICDDCQPRTGSNRRRGGILSGEEDNSWPSPATPSSKKSGRNR